jgi:predicted transporter
MKALGLLVRLGISALLIYAAVYLERKWAMAVLLGLMALAEEAMVIVIARLADAMRKRVAGLSWLKDGSL